MAIPLGVTLGMGALSAIPSLFQLDEASKQRKLAEQLGKTKRPEFDIPDAVEEATNIARYQAIAPFINRKQTEQIGAQAAAGARYATETASSGADAMSVYGGINQNAQNALVNQDIAATQDWRQQQTNLRNQLGVLGGYQEKKWQWEKGDPFEQTMQAKRELEYGSRANKFNAVSNLAGTGSALLYGMWGDKMGGGSKSPSLSDTSSGFGGMQTKPYSFGGIDMKTPETFGGLDNTQKIQQFKMTHGRFPSPQELLAL